MNSVDVTSGYASPLREAQKSETRRRILEAAGGMLGEGGVASLSFGAVAKAAGVQERTVYRHFATKDELLEALWAWLDPRIGLKSFPQSADELIDFPRHVFPAFDDNAALMRALWTSEQGREFRLRVNDRRKEAMRASVAEAVKGLPPEEATAITAAAQLLYSGAAWLTMRDYWGLNGAEAGDASSLALKLLLEGARARAATSRGETT